MTRSGRDSRVTDCIFFAVISPLLIASVVKCSSNSNYLIGVGSYDITGPAGDVNFMGYAKSDQNAAGIHFRQRARAFIVADASNDANRVLFVNLDACMGSQGVTIHVLQRLASRYGSLYTEKNVAISGTHTHSTPGGFLQYVLYIITSLGFVRQTFDALVDGIEQSIVQAHTNLRPGSVLYNEGELLEANINRSPSAYLNNPADEQARYQYNVDKTMVLAKFVDAQWGEVGAFSWFAVHGTSMNNTNRLVSGDNKGAAARFMEDWFTRNVSKSITPDEIEGISTSDKNKFPPVDGKIRAAASALKSLGGKPTTRLSSVIHRVRNPSKDATKPPFVAAFCQSNVGDTSPNILGAFCLDTGLPCDFNTSTCNGQNELCMGRGPGYPGDHFVSTKIIAERQAQKAQELFQSPSEHLSGKVDSRQTYLNFPNLTVTLPNGSSTVTCPAAVGFSFAAGTIDGVGAFDFKQGDTHGNPFWKAVGALLHKPSDEQVACQQPKPVLIDTGEMFVPYAWAPAILPIQILRIGQFIILSVPAEFTTMAGRRLREAVKQTLIQNSNEFGQDTHVVIAGLTNTYSSYVTTVEEYQIQRYEGASTIYGPNTLSAYIQEFQKLATALATGTDVPPGPSPPDLIDQQISMLPPVVVDSTPAGVNFGDLKQDVPANSSFKTGDVVEAIFYTGCPRNDLLTEGTFVLVEILDNTGKWTGLYDDDDWSTQFLWSRPANQDLSPISFATIRWEIPEGVQAGTYRLRHFGAFKPYTLLPSINHFTGTSSSFVVTSS